MSGLHHHHDHHGHQLLMDKDDPSVLKRLRFAFGLNFIFTLIELVGGLLSGSVAILADAVHDLGDSLTIGLSVYLHNKSLKRPTHEFTYGFRRLSLLSALISGVVLVAGSVWIISEASQRLLSESAEPPNGPLMAALAVLGVLVNGVAAYRLSYGRSANEKMISWHLIEDFLGWVAVLIGALAIWLWQVSWIDPVLAIAIAGFVIWNAIRNLVGVGLVFLQRLPPGLNRTQLLEEFKKIEGVKDIHDLHVWTLDGERHVVSLHAVVETLVNAALVKDSIRHVARHYGCVHTTIELETLDEECSENCDDHGS